MMDEHKAAPCSEKNNGAALFLGGEPLIHRVEIVTLSGYISLSILNEVDAQVGEIAGELHLLKLVESLIGVSISLGLVKFVAE